MRRIVPIALVVLLLFAGIGCNSGMPSQAGEYEIKPKSVKYDGQQYEFFWTGKDGQVHEASGDDIKLVEDSRTYLQIADGKPILHLAKEEAITVQAQDRQGGFSTFWYPFMLGRMLAPGGSPVIINQPAPGAPSTPPQTPSYHYPPAGSFGRNDTLQGSITNSKPSAPDYGRIQPAPYAVSGKSEGTGGGTAASGKTGSLSGQVGGTGAGSAASEKGGFKSGDSGFKSSGAPSVGAGSGKAGTSGGAPKGGGFSGGKSSSAGRSGGRGGGK